VDHAKVRGPRNESPADTERGSQTREFELFREASLELSVALSQPNHLLGYRREYIALFFRNQNDLFSVRRELLPIATKNREMLDAVDTYAEVISGETMFEMDYDIEESGKSKSFAQAGAGAGTAGSASDSILDMREYDIPYYLRVAIDKGEPSASSLFAQADFCDGRQISESGSGTKSPRITARLPSPSLKSGLVELSPSSWRSTSRQPRRLSSSRINKRIKS
jgi:hypothetical protein